MVVPSECCLTWMGRLKAFYEAFYWGLHVGLSDDGAMEHANKVLKERMEKDR